MTVTEVSVGKSVLNSSLEIIARESAEANILELGRMLVSVKRQREISIGVTFSASSAPSLSLKEVHTQQMRNEHTHRLLECSPCCLTAYEETHTDLGLICGSSSINKLLAVCAFSWKHKHVLPLGFYKAAS